MRAPRDNARGPVLDIYTSNARSFRPSRSQTVGPEACRLCAPMRGETKPRDGHLEVGLYRTVVTYWCASRAKYSFLGDEHSKLTIETHTGVFWIGRGRVFLRSMSNAQDADASKSNLNYD